MMDHYTVSRIVHILGVILWIGGVSMVTTVIIPAVKRMAKEEDQVNTFEKIEGRFSLQAKFTTLLTGLSGFYMIYLLDGWDRYLEVKYWWMHGMTLVWFLFTMVLFVLEPFFLHRLFRIQAEKNAGKTFRIIHRAHWVLLVLSLIVTIGAIAGSHGLFFI